MSRDIRHDCQQKFSKLAKSGQARAWRVTCPSPANPCYYAPMSHYADNAEALLRQYHQMDPAILHRDWLKHLPERRGLACDIGAGSGRDANWLAGKGWDVIAVEPEPKFRQQARQHSHPNVAWLDDKLPGLSRLRKLNQRFNLILLSAVWMPKASDRC